MLCCCRVLVGGARRLLSVNRWRFETAIGLPAVRMCCTYTSPSMPAACFLLSCCHLDLRLSTHTFKSRACVTGARSPAWQQQQRQQVTLSGAMQGHMTAGDTTACPWTLTFSNHTAALGTQVGTVGVVDSYVACWLRATPLRVFGDACCYQARSAVCVYEFIVFDNS